MRNRYKKITGAILIILLANISYAQVKQQTVPNFTNPFPSKKSVNVNTITSPSNLKKRSVVKNKEILKTHNGSFFLDLKKQKRTKSSVSNDFNTLFGLNSQHSFKKTIDKTDKSNFNHTNYQQFYKGYPIDGSLIMMHSKNSTVNSINGKVAQFNEIEIIVNISESDAKNIAMSYLNVSSLITDYPIEKVISTTPSKIGKTTKLTYKIRIDSYFPFEMCYGYVDAKTGVVLKKINLIAHADTPGTAQTLYSGNQSITCDSYLGNYRLRDGNRNIETYNATSATGFTAAGYTNATDFSNSTATWSGLPILSSFTVASISQNWWYAVFVDEAPDLYIKVIDGSSQTVFASGYSNNTSPSLSFNNLNVLLTNPPYTVEVWDNDVTNGDDFGGSYSITTNTGKQNWSGNGNNGSYLIENQGHPALDVHWGMEVSYDFYLNIFGRNSYDGSGSVVKQYINPPDSLAPIGYPNGASALTSPYNIMLFGMGDGIKHSPLVGLDVEGHEFTHLVVDNNGNGGLTYEGESGALNESFADIMGVCIEFYSGVNPDWNIGEDVMVSDPYLRSLSNPNGGQQPDTYNGLHWTNPSNLQDGDHGGVHTNSGVQNFWFYLLSQGGTGTNDIGNSYSVTGIGISDAQQIAYRNLVNYLSPNATYTDAYNGSLQSAEDLYGNPSTQYSAVRQAWYAVGIGNDPNNFCSGVTDLVAESGTITDGSGIANYSNNANCKWVIAPPGATQVTLDFTEFDTEADYDTIFVYDGPDDTYAVLATWWGNALPPTINTTAGIGAMCIKFTSDASGTANGWSADYTSIGVAPSCDGGTILSSPTGSFSEGAGNYGNNQSCFWFISPPCATSVTLSFSAFDTENGYDGIVIYDDLSGTNQIAVLSGTAIPGNVTSTTGIMTVAFVSDYANSGQGFSASYTSLGSAYCSGLTTLNTSDYGIISDGSGVNNYCNNQDCQWLIQPPQATSITLSFSEFDIEAASSDGQTIYDAVSVYDGTTTAAPLLGKFSGNNIPQIITSTGGSMLVRFNSDMNENKQGWSAFYSSTQNTFCSGNTVLTASSGIFDDGSNTNDYSNNSECSWLIQPTNASSITLSFSSFDTEQDYDGVIVYDGSDNSSAILNQYTGNSIPSSVTSTGGSMYIEFLSDPAARESGWSASYNSTIVTGIEDEFFLTNIKVFPNPSNGEFTIESSLEEMATFQIMDILGEEIYNSSEIKIGINNVDVRKLNKGIYLMKIETSNGLYTQRLVIN